MEEGSEALRKSKKHSFFKVLIGDYTTKLRIPVLFTYRFRSVIPEKATLKASNKSWKVNIEEEDDKELYFKRGWKTFVEDNGLESGEFIVFKYDGNSTFKVKMYGKSACEKETQKRTDQNNYFDVADGGIENHQEKKRPIPQENQRGRNPNRQKLKQDHQIKKEKADSDDHGDVNKRKAQKEADEEESDEVIIIEPDDLIRKTGMHEKPLQKAFNESSKLDSKYPSFRVYLKQVYAEKGILCIPTEFFKQHMINKRQKVEIETVKGAWSVTLILHTKGNRTYARFSAGWTDCVRENHFKTGETLIFKMIQRSNNNCPKFMVRRVRKELARK